jgi:hypothetical protein
MRPSLNASPEQPGPQATPSTASVFHRLLQEAVDAFPQFDVPAGETPNVCGGDLVEWYDGWRERVKVTLGLGGSDVQRRYIGARGTRCPFCLSDQIEGREVTTGNGEATQEMSCLSCGQVWFDEYTLTALTLGEDSTVFCSLCQQPTPASTAHLHQSVWIGDECWDDRLKASE